MSWARVLGFTDPLVCQSSVQNAEVEILPTAKGSFRVEGTLIGMDSVQMQRFEVRLPQVATVAAASDRTCIGFLIDGNSSDLQHCGAEVMPNDIILYGSGVRHQRSSFGFRCGTMSVPADEFLDLCKVIIGREFPNDSRGLIVRPDPALMSRLLKLHRMIGQLAHETPDLLDVPAVCRALEHRLVHVMVRCLADGGNIETPRGGLRHDAIISKFEDFLAANPGRSIYLTEICAAVGIAERTLRASCEEHLGMGPIRFLTLRRMHLVHRALRRADPTKSTVTRIVTDHGFWELGRFSVAYRTLFGESPSETLRSPNKNFNPVIERTLNNRPLAS